MSDLTTALDDLSTTSSQRTNTSESPTKKASSSLGKDDFLELLVTQMKYQDPLNPQSDTDFIAQLAQFSSLEQMQNLNQTSTNSQVFGLVGKEVTVKTTDSQGKEKEITGTVDFVTVQSGKAKISINGTLYPAEDLVKVMDSYYAIQDDLPSVEKAELSFDKNKPLDTSVKINLGKDGYEASSVAVILNGEAVDSANMSFADGVLTIKPAAYASLSPGKYSLNFVFNDPLTTQVKDSVSVTITDSSQSA